MWLAGAGDEVSFKDCLERRKTCGVSWLFSVGPETSTVMKRQPYPLDFVISRAGAMFGGQRDECYNRSATWILLWLRSIAFWL
jgi:hypothetical protein